MPTRSSKSKTTSTKKTSTKRASTSTTKSTAASKAKTTASKAKTSKTAAPVTEVAKAAPTLTDAAKAATAPAPKPVTATVSKLEPVIAGPAMRKKELLDEVTAKTGIKRSEVKKVLEAALATMGHALQDSRELNLQPFGTVKINRERKLAEGKVIVARIRQARDLPADDMAAGAPVEDAQAKTAAE